MSVGIFGTSAEGIGSCRLRRLGRVSPRRRLTFVGVGAGPRLPTCVHRGEQATIGLDSMADIGHVMSMHTTTRSETTQDRLDRLMAAAQRRLAVGATITNRRGTARWNGDAWVYGKER